MLLCSYFIDIIRPMTFALRSIIRNLNVRLTVVSDSIYLSETNRFSTGRATTSQQINRRIFRVTNPSRKNVTTRFLGDTAMKLSRINGQFLRRILRRTLLVNICLIRFISIGRGGTTGTTLHFLLTLRISAINMTRARLQ